MNKKVTVVGAGHVGATCAQRIAEKNLADVALLDIVVGLPQGKALDMMESAPVEGFKAKITGTNDYAATKNSDIAVITSGLPRKPGMSRDDLLVKNARIVSAVVKNIVKFSPQVIIIMVTNPLDAMCYLALQVSGFQPRRVVGMAGVLDSARYRYFVAEALGVLPREVETMMLGGHGDSMVPLPRFSKVKGTPLTELLSPEKIQAINDRARKGGAEIVGFLKTGSAYYAPSAAVTEMAGSILRDENKTLPCSAYLSGEYGLQDVYCGVPVQLSGEGVKKIVELELTDNEKAQLMRSSEAIRATINRAMKQIPAK